MDQLLNLLPHSVHSLLQDNPVELAVHLLSKSDLEFSFAPLLLLLHYLDLSLQYLDLALITIAVQMRSLW